MPACARPATSPAGRPCWGWDGIVATLLLGWSRELPATGLTILTIKSGGPTRPAAWLVFQCTIRVQDFVVADGFRLDDAIDGIGDLGGRPFGASNGQGFERPTLQPPRPGLRLADNHQARSYPESNAEQGQGRAKPRTQSRDRTKLDEGDHRYDGQNAAKKEDNAGTQPVGDLSTVQRAVIQSSSGFAANADDFISDDNCVGIVAISHEEGSWDEVQ